MAHKEDEPDTPLVSTLVIRKVAEREGVDPVDLDQQLDDTVNTEALDQLFAPKPTGIPRKGGTVEFTYCGYHATIESPRSVLIEQE